MRGKIYIQFLIFGSTLLFHLYNTWLYREKMRYICQIPEMLRFSFNSANFPEPKSVAGSSFFNPIIVAPTTSSSGNARARDVASAKAATGSRRPDTVLSSECSTQARVTLPSCSINFDLHLHKAKSIETA